MLLRLPWLLLELVLLIVPGGGSQDCMRLINRKGTIILVFSKFSHWGWWFPPKQLGGGVIVRKESWRAQKKWVIREGESEGKISQMNSYSCKKLNGLTELSKN
ncbi:hypothetical protein HYDPIDRAFT_169731 [Hydnomerulius pinastri MD-312]|uniref:Secreted protein n=1 Tax=Hydnomerulius pinastri MD-312 TaxID=994086 RepID=A0A0C9WBU4_9AGAM|nr:hypothetical protein HYDPIDRAFT_169731 [Hydnomerulius pinastri MD-312]